MFIQGEEDSMVRPDPGAEGGGRQHQARPDAKHASHADAGETTRTILASERLADVVTKLYRYDVDRLYVVDEQCILLGVVLAVDIIRLVVQVQCAPLEDAAGDIARD